MSKEIIKFIEEERERGDFKRLCILNTAVNTLKAFGLEDIDILIKDIGSLRR